MKKKQKPFFAIFRIITLFVMGLLIAFVIALSQVNLETLRGNILLVLREATDLPVEIDGEVSWKFSLRPRIELNKVRVANADWAKHKNFFSADKIDVTLNLLSLFRDRPTIQNVKIHNAELCVEQNEAGDYSIITINNDSKTADAKNSAPADFPFEDPGLGGVEVKNLTAHILDEQYKLKGFQLHYVPKDDTREYAGWIRSNKNVFPFIVSYSKYNEERKVYPVKIAFATGGDALIANIALEGTSKQPIDFIIKGDIPDVAEIGEIFNLKLSDVPDLTVSIAGGLDRKKLTLRKSYVVVRDNKISFSGDVNWSGKKVSVNANVDSDKIDLLEIYPELYGKPWIRPNRDLNVFKDTPLFGTEFLKFNLNLKARVGQFVFYRKMNLQDIDLNLKINNGQGRLDISSVFANGDVKVASDFDIDTSGRYYIRAAGKGTNVFAGTILSELNYNDFISELPLDFETYLEANGTNLSEVMLTLTGPVKIYSVGTGYAHSALVANIYGTDFLTSLRHSIQDLFRSEKKYNQINISCLAINTKFRQGLAETQNGVAMETNAINVRLAGSLNLGQETIKLSLMTVPVRGLKLSLTGNVVNSIEITGNLAEPDIQISGAAVAGKVASATGIGLLLAPFTGGIGLVAGAGVGLLAGDLLENWLADTTPCQTALERGAPAKRGDVDWLNLPVQDLMNQVFEK